MLRFYKQLNEKIDVTCIFALKQQDNRSVCNSSAFLFEGFGGVTVLLAAGVKPARPYYATLQAYPCTPSLFFLPFSPSLTKTYVTRLSPPNTSPLQSFAVPLFS